MSAAFNLLAVGSNLAPIRWELGKCFANDPESSLMERLLRLDQHEIT